MSQQKAAKLLAKALNNSSKEEALTAFGMAWTYAQLSNVKLSSIHTITEERGPITDDREAELVEKYNALLLRAQELREEKERWRRMYTCLHTKSGMEGEAAEKLRKLKNYIKRL